jgi:hypothetical protein
VKVSKIITELLEDVFQISTYFFIEYTNLQKILEDSYELTFLPFQCLVSGSGVITRDELRVFYSSFLGFSTQKVGEVLDLAYSNMTSVSMENLHLILQ